MYWNDEPKLWPAFLYALPTLLGAWLYEVFPETVVGLVLGGGFALIGGILTAVTVIVYFGKHAMTMLDGLAHAATRTKQSTAAEAVKNLSPDQLAVVRFTGEMSVGLRMTARGPLFMVEGTGVPLAFVKFEFLPRCAMDVNGVTHLASIGSWSDGLVYRYRNMNFGTCRMLARRFTEYLVDNGVAVWGAGNQSATLVGDMTVFELRKAFGMQLREPEFGLEEDWMEEQVEVSQEA